MVGNGLGSSFGRCFAYDEKIGYSTSVSDIYYDDIGRFFVNRATRKKKCLFF